MKHLQILQNTKNIRKKAQGICFFAVIGLSTLIFQFSCGGKVITEIQTYKANLPPEIVVFTSDSPGGATLLPNQVFHVHVEAMDPNEGNKISFKFDSKIGSFSGQSDTETTSDVVFTLPGILSAGFTAIATVTVTDQKGASSAKDLDLGSGRTGPLITVNTGVVTYPYLKDTDCTSVGWSADADGFFQVNLLKDINASCAVDTSVSGNFKFYTKNTPIEVFVHGINGKSSCHAETVASVYTPLTNGKANNDQNYKLCLVTRDALAQDSFISYNYTLDNVPPVTTPTPLIASQTFKAVPSTVLNCADALSPCKDVSYTVDYTSATQVSPAGITPNFAGIGTVMNYTSNVSPVFPVGSQGDGAYRFNFISRDAAGNQEVSSSVFWMNAISPVVTAAAPSHAVLTTTGNIAFQRSDIVWSSNDLGTFQVLINPTNAVNPCNSGGTQVSAGTLTGINQNITSSILATDLPNEGANTIYICINDGFTDAWASKTIKRDNTPPLQSTTFGPGTFSASPTGTFSCTDSNACSIAYSVAFNADTQTAPAAAALAFPGTLTGPTSSMITLGTADGTYTIQYQAVDEVGNISIAPATLSLSLDAVAPTITQGVSVLQVTSTGAVSPVNNASIDWSTNQNSSYYVMQGAACGGTTLGATNITAGGTSVSGTVSGATITSILNAPTLTPALTAGSNTVNICVFDGFTTATKAVTVVLDNTAAVTSVSPNIHNGNFQLAQSVTFNCSDIATGNSGCNGIRYIESNPPNTLVSGTFPAGTTPTFTAATIGATPGTGTGTLINSGAAVSLGALGDGKYTTTFVSLDNVGNVEAVKTINYTIDSTLPALTLVTPFTNSVVTTTGAAAYNTSSITWSSSVDANYYILINPPAGGAGSCTSGGGLTGGATIAATTNVTTTVTASAAAPSPWINGQNVINICATGNGTTFTSIIANLTLDDTPPTITPTALNALPSYYSTAPNVTFNCTDTGAGCLNMVYAVTNTPNSSVAPTAGTVGYTSLTTASSGTLANFPFSMNIGTVDAAYTVAYIAHDAVGNTSTVASFSFGLNATLPSIGTVTGPTPARITGTASGGATSSTLTWNGNETGQKYLVNVNTACPAFNNATWSTATAVTSTAAGSISTTINAGSLTPNFDNTIYLCLNDGFAVASVSKIIHRDDSPPVSTLTSGVTSFGSATYAAPPSVTFACTDPNAGTCSSIAYSIGYTANSATVTTTAATPNFTASGANPSQATTTSGSMVTLGNLGDGAYQISRVSQDSLLNKEATVTMNFSVDAIHPTISAAAPANLTVSTTGVNTQFRSTSIAWSTNQISSYYVMVNAACSSTTLGTTNATGTTAGGLTNSLTSASNVPASTSIITTINAGAVAPWVVNANNTINICVFDGFTTATSSATIYLDNTGPISPPTVAQTSLGATSATFNVTAGTGDTIYYDWSTGGAYSTLQLISATPSFTPTGLTAGTQYTLSVRGYDAVGNVSAITTLSFTPGYTITMNVTNPPITTTANGLKLTLATGDTLTFTSSAAISQTFTTRLNSTAPYSIATTQQPVTSPGNVCSFVENAWGAIASANKILNVNCITGYQYAHTIAPSNPTGNRSMTTDTLYTTNLTTGVNGVFGMAKVGNMLYFTTQGANQVKSLNLTTNTIAILAGSGAAGHADGSGTAAMFNDPRGVTTDGSNLYVAEYTGNFIRKINIATAAVTTLAGTGVNTSTDNANPLAATVGGPVGIDIWGNNLIFEEYNFHRVRKINLTTGAVTTIAGTGTAGYADNANGTSAQFNLPHGLTVDSINNVAYVADSNNHRIRKIDLTANAVTTVAGSGVAGFKDGVALQAQMNNPVSLTVYKDKLLFYDSGNASLRSLNVTTGIVTTLSSGVQVGGNAIGTADDARYSSNGCILVSDNGDIIYFADAYNNAIRSISNNLAAQYTFDDAGSATSKDFSGNFKDATLYGSPTAVIDENGTANGAYRFNGTNQYIKISPAVSTKTSNFTYSVWINPADNAFGTILENGTTYNIAIFHQATGTIGIYTSNSSYLITSSAIPLNTWTHIALRNNAGTWELFINGISAGTNATATMGAPNSTTIGASSGGTNYFFNGKISEVRMYERSLTNREIKRLAVQVPEGLIRYYPMDGDVTDTAIFQKNGTIPATGAGNYQIASSYYDRFNNATGAYKFDGTDDYIYASDANLPGRTAAQTAGTGKAPRTVCTWVITNNAATNQGVFNYGTNIANQLYALDLWAGQYWNLGWGANYLIGSPRTSEWTHLCSTYDGASTTAIYENGAWLGSSIVASNWDTVLNGILYLGREPGDVVFLNGSLDDFRIYGRVLSVNEITSLAEPSGISFTTTLYSGSDGHIKHGILPGSLQTFKLAATANNIYSLWWDDSLSGSGTTTANVTVSASYLTSGAAIFSNIDSAYLNSAVQRFKATATDTVMITVNNPGASTGVYGIKANEFANLSFTYATALATQTYSTAVVAGKTYSIWWDDAFCCSGTRTLDIYVGASGQGAGLTLGGGAASDSGYTTPYTFTATATGNVTITVRAYSTLGGTGTFGLMVSSP